MGRLVLAAVAMALIMLAAPGCDPGSSPHTGQPPAVGGSSAPCPYAGAIVNVTYAQEADLGRIRDVLVSLGWKQTDARGLLYGTLDGVAVAVSVRDGSTDLSVHVLQSTNEADYPDEDRLAESILRRVKAPVEERLGLPPQDRLERRINRGCEG